ncbi:MAG: hypothetical protein DMG34_16970 [Acidobacteria bacterium]|nr:MAG: hypothetical protein DMG34_16970 [Acidobacteriota bacterium]
MSNVVPFPLPVEMFAVKEPRDVPPPKTPPSPITHDALVPAALKLPLDWAKAMGAIEAAIANALANIFNFIIWFPPILAVSVRTLIHESLIYSVEYDLPLKSALKMSGRRARMRKQCAAGKS